MITLERNNFKSVTKFSKLFEMTESDLIQLGVTEEHSKAIVSNLKEYLDDLGTRRNSFIYHLYALLSVLLSPK